MSADPLEEGDFKSINYAPGYPKRVEVKCYCHITKRWDMTGYKPAEKLCKLCEAWQAWFERQYKEECEKAGKLYLPLPVDIQPGLGV